MEQNLNMHFRKWHEIYKVLSLDLRIFIKNQLSLTILYRWMLPYSSSTIASFAINRLSQYIYLIVAGDKLLRKHRILPGLGRDPNIQLA